MTTPVSPNTSPEFPTSLLGPTDGEIANAASVIMALQPEMDALDFLRQQAMGTLYRNVWCQSSPQLNVKPMGKFIVNASGTWKILNHVTLSTFDVTTKGATLVASSRYWVYAFGTGGIVDFEVSTTPPDAKWQYKAGDTSRIFVSTFFTNKDSTILPYVHDSLDFRYCRQSTLAGGIGGNVIQPFNNSLTLIQVDTGPSVPLGAVSVEIAYEVSSDSTSVPFGAALFQAAETVFPVMQFDGVKAANNIHGIVRIPLITGLSQVGFKTFYTFDATALWAIGFRLK